MTSKEAAALIGSESIRRLTGPSRWADLGCGSGLFTLTLAGILQPGSTVYAVDRQTSLPHQTTAGGVEIQPLVLDFVKEGLVLQDIALRQLDGILMANSLHYVKDPPALLNRLKEVLRPVHAYIIVEYDTDKPVSTWVPYPLSFSNLQSLFRMAGYAKIEKLGTKPSLYGRAELYAALIH